MNRNMIFTALSVLAFVSGCHHCCKKMDCCGPAPIRPAGPGGSNPYLLPPAGVPTTPTPGTAIVPGVGPTNLPPTIQNYPPPVLGPITPPKPSQELLLPDPIPGTGSSRSASPGNNLLGTPTRPQTSEPPTAANPVTVGLPGYVRVSDGLASGQKPSVDGFEALRQAGFRTVIYLHPAGTDVTAAREVAEKRNLKFVAIETTPANLGTAVEQFNTTLADKASRPAYVYDDDGVRAGAVWYLHFRTAEKQSDDVARVRAKPLGLTDQGDDGKEFSLAIARYLETR